MCLEYSPPQHEILSYKVHNIALIFISSREHVPILYKELGWLNFYLFIYFFIYRERQKDREEVR